MTGEKQPGSGAELGKWAFVDAPTTQGVTAGSRSRIPQAGISASALARPSVRDFKTHPPRVLYAANVATFFHKFLLPYASHFRSQGWQVDAMSNGFYQSETCKFEKYFHQLWEIEWARKPHELRRAGKLIRQIRTIAGGSQYDIIHVHTPVAAMMTRFALRGCRHPRTKVLYTAHGFHFYKGAPKASGTVFKQLEKVAGRWTDYLVVMNEEDHQAARDLKHIPQDRVVFMPGIGIDLSRYSTSHEDRVAGRYELGIAPEDFVILSVAEFIPRKRQADIVHALKRMHDKRVKLVFAGDGETFLAIQHLVDTFGLSDQVKFLGNRPDVPLLLAAADCSVLASSQEGLPRSVMESMCCGVPVIATDIRGTRDLLGGGAGHLYPVGDIDALVAAIKEVQADGVKSRSATMIGRERVKKYDIMSVIGMHETLYAEALGVDPELIVSSRPNSSGCLI